jgi:hypothetical protein
MGTDKKFPFVSKELLEELERRFPDVMPEKDLGLETIRFKQGQVSVIRLLRANFDFQNRNILENK